MKKLNQEKRLSKGIIKGVVSPELSPFFISQNKEAYYGYECMVPDGCSVSIFLCNVDLQW